VVVAICLSAWNPDLSHLALGLEIELFSGLVGGFVAICLSAWNPDLSHLALGLEIELFSGLVGGFVAMFLLSLF